MFCPMLVLPYICREKLANRSRGFSSVPASLLKQLPLALRRFARNAWLGNPMQKYINSRNTRKSLEKTLFDSI